MDAARRKHVPSPVVPLNRRHVPTPGRTLLAVILVACPLSPVGFTGGPCRRRGNDTPRLAGCTASPHCCLQSRALQRLAPETLSTGDVGWAARQVSAFVLAILVAGVLVAPSTAALADDKLAKVAPCLLSQCQVPLAKCILDLRCAADLTCIIGCSGSPDEKTCQIKCGDNFEDDIVGEFNACALSSKKCVPQRPDVGPLPGDRKWTPVNGRYPVPPPDSLSQDFEVEKMTGAWYISAGLNPLFDTFPCQAHFFEGTAPSATTPGRLVGKINWRVAEPDGEFLSRSTVQTFIQTSPGVLENHNNEYLHYQDDWYVLDHGFEDDPQFGFVLIYYRGQNDAWAGYGGGTLYTRARKPPPEIFDRVAEATEKARVPFYKYWTITDNSCTALGDPVKLRAEFAERLAAQAAQSAEAQLTYLTRSAVSEVDKDERYVIRATKRLEKMTVKFFENEQKLLKKARDEFEVDLERKEKAWEAPFLAFIGRLLRQ